MQAGSAASRCRYSCPAGNERSSEAFAPLRPRVLSLLWKHVARHLREQVQHANHAFRLFLQDNFIASAENLHFLAFHPEFPRQPDRLAIPDLNTRVVAMILLLIYIYTDVYTLASVRKEDKIGKGGWHSLSASRRTPKRYAPSSRRAPIEKRQH